MSDENIIEINNGDVLIEIADSYESTVIVADTAINLDYYYATNKPKINSKELSGNLDSDELQLVSPSDLTVFGEKVSTISENSTNNEYPGAKCVFDNLEMKLNKSQITNCILNNPQNIKLELNNGTLTLKAGSVVCVPNGFESDGVTPKFDEVSISSDVTLSGRANNDIICYDADNNTLYMSATGTSGSSVPTTSTWFYNTNTNLLKRYSSGSSNTGKCSFPICMVSNNGTTYSSIDQTFQSIGYIGSTVFVRKGLKVLIPDGRNADGSLKNVEIVTNNVLTKTEGSSATNTTGTYLLLTDQNELDMRGASSTRYYDNITNYFIQDGVKYAKCIIAKYIPTSGVISNFQPYTAANILKYSDKSQISGWGMPSSRYVNLTLGASGSTYTAPANGWCYLFGSSGNSTYVTNLTNSSRNFAVGTQTIGWYAYTIPCCKGDVISYTYTTTPSGFRFIYAKGEI